MRLASCSLVDIFSADLYATLLPPAWRADLEHLTDAEVCIPHPSRALSIAARSRSVFARSCLISQQGSCLIAYEIQRMRFQAHCKHFCVRRGQ